MSSTFAHSPRRTRVRDPGRSRPAARDRRRTADLTRTDPVGNATTRQLAAIVEQSNDAIILKSVDGVIEEWNSGAERLYGYTVQETLGQPMAILIPSERQGEETELLARALAGRPSMLETRRRRKDGSVVDVSLAVSPIRNAAGAIVAASSIAREITERKQVEAQLRFLAEHDPLTGIANRRKFEEQLDTHLSHANRYGSHGALLMLDIDRFKQVNDSLGHRAGDRLIKAIAGILRDRLRHSDTVARLGGDEFAVLLPKANRTEAAHVAAELLTAVRSNVTLSARAQGQVTTSIGISLFDANSEQLDPETGLREADRAMYEAKQAGGDRYAFYAHR